MTPIKADNTLIEPLPEQTRADPVWLRWLLICFGWLMVATGIVGIVVPVMPTTVFMIAALWAFSRSSRKFQIWLWTHSTFGPPVRNWHLYRVISVRAKMMAVMVMTLSFVYILIWVAEDWRVPVIVGAIMLPAAIYVVTRRGQPPKPERVPGDLH